MRTLGFNPNEEDLQQMIFTVDYDGRCNNHYSPTRHEQYSQRFLGKDPKFSKRTTDVKLLMRWTLDLKVSGLTPDPCPHVVSLDKKLCSTLPPPPPSGPPRAPQRMNGYRPHDTGVTLQWTGTPSRDE